jgi:2-polyprenyl-3-methyl-5-hydroxy-6-metoxy-1,4-benzoquinol methylase
MEAASMNDRPEIQFHDQLAAKWEGLHRSDTFKSRTAAMFGLLDQVPSTGRSWLDAGCGTGTLARILASRGIDVQGIDASAKMVGVANKLSDVETSSGRLSFRQIETIESTPFDDGTFDGVLCASVLEYTPSPERCLAEFRRILRSDGLLLISIPNRRSLLRKTYKLARPFVRKLFSRPVLQYLQFSHFETSAAGAAALLQRHGFTVIGYNFAGSPLPKLFDQRETLGTLINILARRNGDRIGP